MKTHKNIVELRVSFFWKHLDISIISFTYIKSSISFILHFVSHLVIRAGESRRNIRESHLRASVNPFVISNPTCILLCWYFPCFSSGFIFVRLKLSLAIIWYCIYIFSIYVCLQQIHLLSFFRLFILLSRSVSLFY